MTTKKKVSETSQPEVQCFKSEHWTINYRGGFNAITRVTKTFYIPDAELDELAQLIAKWQERESPNDTQTPTIVNGKDSKIEVAPGIWVPEVIQPDELKLYRQHLDDD